MPRSAANCGHSDVHTSRRRCILKPRRQFFDSAYSFQPPFLNCALHSLTPASLMDIIAAYYPSLLGHPHQVILPDDSSLFPHQSSPWLAPDKNLYWYPGIGFRTGPLYSSVDMDGRPIVIGYGPKSVYSKPSSTQCTKPSSTAPTKPHFAQPVSKPVGNRAPREMVDVFSGETFVERISLKTLVRFSRLAANVLPKQSSLVAITHQPASPSIPVKGEQLVDTIEEIAAFDGKSLSWADDADHASEKDVQSITSLSSPGNSQTDTTPTSVATDKHKPISPASTKQVIQPSLSWASVENTSHNIKILKLRINAMWLPTMEAVRYVIKWMKDNATTPGDSPLLPYAPSNLSEYGTVELVDYYSAAVLFNMRPFPRELRQELMRRITASSPLSFKSFDEIVKYVPAGDSLVTRAINQIHYGHRKNQYTPEQIAQFDNLLNDDDYSELSTKVQEITAHHREVDETRRRQHGQESQQKYWARSAKNVNDAATFSNQASVVDSPPVNVANQPRGRRRNRRGQQSEGNAMGKDGRHVVGAEY